MSCPAHCCLGCILRRCGWAQATLEEVREADLLLHVVDASSPNVAQQRCAVMDVLRYLGISQSALHSNVIEARPIAFRMGQPAEQYIYVMKQDNWVLPPQQPVRLW